MLRCGAVWRGALAADLPQEKGFGISLVINCGFSLTVPVRPHCPPCSHFLEEKEHRRKETSVTLEPISYVLTGNKVTLGLKVVLDKGPLKANEHHPSRKPGREHLSALLNGARIENSE